MKEEKEKFKLVEGTFKVSDAKEILLGLIEHKIQFHNRKIHGHAERHGEVDTPNKERLKVLRQTRDKLIEYLDAHTSEMVHIHSDITIELKHQAD